MPAESPSTARRRTRSGHSPRRRPARYPATARPRPGHCRATDRRRPLRRRPCQLRAPQLPVRPASGGPRPGALVAAGRSRGARFAAAASGPRAPRPAGAAHGGRDCPPPAPPGARVADQPSWRSHHAHLSTRGSRGVRFAERGGRAEPTAGLASAPGPASMAATGHPLGAWTTALAALTVAVAALVLRSADQVPRPAPSTSGVWALAAVMAAVAMSASRPDIDDALYRYRVAVVVLPRANPNLPALRSTLTRAGYAQIAQNEGYQVWQRPRRDAPSATGVPSDRPGGPPRATRRTT